jgi:hypothetical protein
VRIRYLSMAGVLPATTPAPRILQIACGAVIRGPWILDLHERSRGESSTNKAIFSIVLTMDQISSWPPGCTSISGRRRTRSVRAPAPGGQAAAGQLFPAVPR